MQEQTTYSESEHSINLEMEHLHLTIMNEQRLLQDEWIQSLHQ